MLTSTNWSDRIQIKWDAVDETNSTVKVNTILPAEPPHVETRRGLWRVTANHGRVFADAYEYKLNTPKVNNALREGRGRALVATDVRNEHEQAPLAALAWHLPQQLTEPLFVTALAPRVTDDASVKAVVDQGLVLLLDALLYVATEHEQWVRGRLPGSEKQKDKSAQRLGVLHVDVAARDQLARYLTELLPGHVAVAARVPSGTTLLRVSP